MYYLRYGTTVSRPCIMCFMSREEAGRMEGAARQDMEGTRSGEKYGKILGKISELKVTEV